MSMRTRVLLRAVVLSALATASTVAFGATVTYDAGGTSVWWNNPLNWSTDTLPTSSDDVVITNAGGFEVALNLDVTVNSITIQNGAVLWIGENRVLMVNDSSTIDAGGFMNIQEAATFSGSGDLTVNGTLHIFGGTVGGSGALTVSSGGWLRAWAGYNSSVIARTTTNAGTMRFRYDPPAFPAPPHPGTDFTFSGATLTNTGTIEFLSDHDIHPGLGSPIWNNNSGGVIRKIVNGGPVAINFPVNNAAGATIETQTGHFYLNGGGTVSGAYSIFPGSELRLGPDPVTFTMSGTPTVSGGELRIVGATLDVGAGVNVTVPKLGLAFGRIDGPGALHVSSEFTWSAGTIAGSGPRVLNGTSVSTIDCSLANCLLDGAALQLQAFGTYSASTYALVLSNGASLILDPGKTLNVISDGDFLNGGGAASSIVVGGFASGFNGCIWKTTTSGTTIIGVPVTLSGSFLVEAGTLQVAAGASVAAGAIVDYRPGATLEVSGGLFLFNSSAVAFPFNGDFKVSGGTLRVPTGVTVTMPNVTLQGSGVVDGGGTLVLSGTGTWAGGTLNGSLQNNGTLNVSGNLTGSGTIANNGTLSAVGNSTISAALDNSGQVTTSNALTLAGSGTHTGSFTVTAPGALAFSSGTHSMTGGGSIGGSGALTFSGATATVGVPVSVGALNVSAGMAAFNASSAAGTFTMTGGTLGGSGTLTLNNGGTWSGGTLSGSLQNNGTLNVSGNVAGSGTIANNGTLSAVGNSTISAALHNSGQVTTSNVLTLAGSGTHTGSFTVTAPGTLAFSSGTHSMTGGGSIGGSGTLTFSGAAATVGVPVSVGALNVSAGTAAFNASSTAGTFTMTGGTLGGSGTLTLNNGGTWFGGTLNGGLQNDGTLNVSGNVTGSGTIANNGTLNATGNVTIGTALHNSGQITTSYALALAGSGTHSGSFQITAPGAIDFSSGSHTIAGPLAGTGTLRFSGAAATVSGSWSGMPFEVTGGSVALDTNGTMPALTLSGGTLTGNGDVTVTGPSTWSGGTLGGSGTVTFDPGATVTMPGTAAVTLARPLLNHGTIDFAAAWNGMLIHGVTVSNDGTVNILSSQGITATAGTPPFLNLGTLTKTGDSGVMQFDAPISNSGLVQIESGTMEFVQSYAQSAGTTTVLSGATLKTPIFSLDGGALTGNGTVAGTVASHATVSPGNSPGTLTISGDYVQSSGGVLEIQLGGTTQYDRLLVGGSVTLDGTLDVTTISGFTPAPGNAFPIMTFGSRAGQFAVVNGLTGPGAVLAPAFSANALQLVANRLPVTDVGVGVTGPTSTLAGTQVIYTVTVSNNGPDPATSIAVTATASPGLTFSANSGACAGSFPCTIAALGSGQQATIHSAWNIAPSATGAVQLTVAASAAADANASNDRASAITSIGTCPAITIVAPGEMTSGAAAEATATPFDGAAYLWSIVNGTIDSGNGTAGITFTAGEGGTTRLTVNVTGGGCTLGATADVTVKVPLTCTGTATPTAPADGDTADGVVTFAWNAVDGASGYRLWLQQDDAPPRSLGRTLDPSRTEIIPPGTWRWYVETLFDGCASHESERRALTIREAQDCASREAPQLSAPAGETPVASSAVAFLWNAVPQALEYELWLAPAGGVPTLIQTTSDTSYTAVVPPGRLEWYVRAVFAGCAATESAHRAFTSTPPPDCTRARPLLIAPVEGERLTSPVSFEWTPVPGAASYELYVDGVLTATTTSPHAADLSVPLEERRWQVRARLAEGCGAVDSAESRMVVIAPPPGCAPLEAPLLSAPAQISSGTAGRIQWSFVPGATAYEVQISGDSWFPPQSTSASIVTTRQLPFTFTNQSGAPVERYVRVHAIDMDCVQPGRGAFSPVAVVSVLPPATTGGVALLTDPTDVPYTLNIAAGRAGQSFTATPTVPWISVTPASGIVPPGGQTLRAVAHTRGLPPGTSTGGVEITTNAAGVGLAAIGPSPITATVPLPLNNIPGVTTAPKSTPPPEALIIPAVASVTNFIVRYQSDICVTNTSAQVMKYEIDFVPSGPAGMREGQKTNVSLEPGATMAINDIVATWFGGRTSTGTLEIRPLTETDTSSSGAAAGRLANRTTFASSRTFSTTAAGGTYGQYVPAVPYARFIAKGSSLSLQHIAQSDRYRTNLGLIEGSGEKVSLEVRVFDAAGAKRASFPVDLNGGERAQLDGVLAGHGLALDDARIEVEVTGGAGKVTAYASVLDNASNDAQLVPPVTLDHAGHDKWVVPGVADLVSGSGHWQTDVRIFNAGTEAADLTLAFYSMNGGPATTRTIALAAGEVRQLDRVLSFFGVSGDAGALHVSSAAPAQVVATARTYQQTAGGAYGQFIAAVTPDESVAVGSRPLQILQMEESPRFQSNIGFAEVSGKPVTLEVAVFRPDSHDPAVLEVSLEPNQFRQLSSLLASVGLGEMYNARISVRAVGGEGRALAYGSLIDHKTGDPTYIPGQ